MRAGQRAPSATFLRVSIAACCLSILLVCVTGELLGCAFKRSLSQKCSQTEPRGEPGNGRAAGADASALAPAAAQRASRAAAEAVRSAGLVLWSPSWTAEQGEPERLTRCAEAGTGTPGCRQGRNSECAHPPWRCRLSDCYQERATGTCSLVTFAPLPLSGCMVHRPAACHKGIQGHWPHHPAHHGVPQRDARTAKSAQQAGRCCNSHKLQCGQHQKCAVHLLHPFS